MDTLGVALRMTGVTKRFPGTLAVDSVDLDVRAGEVHALLGQNGAGKSTLMKILAGQFSDYQGEIRISERRMPLHSPAAAKEVGISMIHQELSLAGPLSIAENILAGRLPSRFGWLDRRSMETQARRLLVEVGLGDLPPWTPVSQLSQHEAQLVEIAKALGSRPCILVMDEPTSALSRAEVERLFEIIRRLRRNGLAIVYISHHLPEILDISDRVTVLRDGRRIGTLDAVDATAHALVEMMVGRSVERPDLAARPAPGLVRFEVDCLSRYGFYHDVSFAIRRGEILGLGGLAGAGRSEVARSIVALDPVDAGEVRLDGEELAPGSAQDALRAGIAYLPEDRKAEGLALDLGAMENLIASATARRRRRLGARDRQTIFARLAGDLRLDPPRPRRQAMQFSGGNQQKILLGKSLAVRPDVCILDEPTRGVDVAAKQTIHQAIADLAASGACVLLISSDLPELVGLSDRVVVMRAGRVVGELAGETLTEDNVLLAANGELPSAKGAGHA